MAQPIVKYAGEAITCYPGSNQTDDGKLNMEFNMARIVTRLSSKNFCIVKPSFNIEPITNVETGAPQLRILKGQCSINGMDLIIEDSIVIDPPENPGKYHLAFKLARDSSWNVLGDLVYGSSTTFEGLYLTYYDNKPDPVEADMLYLGEINWDGTQFSDIVEDEDKYGRIWAEDILCKIKDPKHPNVSRLTLQEWIYKVPDWYVSKEGDVEYGAIEFLPGREGIQDYGVKIQATDNNTSLLKMKAPSITSGDSREFIIESNTKGIKINFLDTEINCYKDMGSDLYWNTKSAIYINSKEDINIKGDYAVALSSLSKTAGKYNHLVVADDGLVYSSDITSDLKYIVNIKDTAIIQQTLGKSIWQYSNTTKKISLLQDNVSYLDIIPNTDYTNNVRIKSTLYLGDSTLYGDEKTYLKKTQWRLTDANASKYIDFTPERIDIVNPSLSSTNNSSIRLRNSADSIHTIIYDNGKIELLNSTEAAGIRFYDGNSAYNAAIWKVLNEKKLNVDGNLGINGNLYASGSVTGNAGLITQNGILTFILGNNNATITKVSGSTTLKTNGDLYLGATSNANLYANNGTFKGTTTFGSSGQTVIASNGDLSVNGTKIIDAANRKVYMAVYNDIVEFMEKENYDEEIEAGDVVYFNDEGKVCKWHEGISSTAIAGVVSSEETYGAALGGEGLEDNQKVPVALKGRVWVKTDNTFIHAGDILAVDSCGCVYKQDPHIGLDIYTIGIATSKEKDGKVLVMIK